MALGYSSAGTVVAVGEGIQDFQVGDRVACAGGGYAVHAEYAVVPHNLLARLPDNVDFEFAAFTTLGAIALHGFRLAQPQLGESVAVIGLGLLGLLAAGIARAAGCRVFGVDLAAERVELAQEMGSPAVLRADAESAALAFTQGRGFDVVLVCADSPFQRPHRAGREARPRPRPRGGARRGGAGHPAHPLLQQRAQLHRLALLRPGALRRGLRGARHDYPIGFVRWTEGRNLQAVVDLIAAGQLDVRPLISHRFPIEVVQAYELITGKLKQPFLGVLLTYPETTEAAPARRVELTPAKSAQPVTDELAVGVLGAGNYASAGLPARLAEGRRDRKSGYRLRLRADCPPRRQEIRLPLRIVRRAGDPDQPRDQRGGHPHPPRPACAPGAAGAALGQARSTARNRSPSARTSWTSSPPPSPRNSSPSSLWASTAALPRWLKK